MAGGGALPTPLHPQGFGHAMLSAAAMSSLAALVDFLAAGEPLMRLAFSLGRLAAAAGSCPTRSCRPR